MTTGLIMPFDYDLFVIGGGSGGVRAARIAASEGQARVALAEESRMGGTCVIRGCVPKKLIVFAAGHGRGLADAQAYGWQVSAGGFDWPGFQIKLRAELERLETAYRGTLSRSGVTVFDSRATLADPHTVVLADGQKITAAHILVATGGWPDLPDHVQGQVMTSNEIFDMAQLPRTILIVGGGYIACEFACVLAGLGVQVTQYYRGTQILRGFDDEARGHVARAMVEQGIDLSTMTDVASLSRGENGTVVHSTTGDQTVFDAVLYATGRRPNTQGLGLEALGIALGPNGAVPVDDYSQTVIPSIFAVGDATDRVNLTPVAIREGHAFADTVFRGIPTKADHDLIASAVFTRPELASIGLTEEAATALGPIEVYTATFRPMHSAFAGRADQVMMKLVVCRQTRRVLGCHIVGDQAGEMIQLAAIAVKMGATKEDFDRTVAVHPTMAEELVTMRNPTRVT